MKIKRMTVTNLRALEHVEFEFDPLINLIVGVNGVGKSTVLDALRIGSSRILPLITKSRTKAMSFSIDDIRSGRPFLDVDVSFEHNLHAFRYTRREWREKFATDDKENIEKLKREIRDSVRLRDRMRNMIRELDESQVVSDTDSFVPSQKELKKSASASKVAPNCIFFSTSRSVVSDAGASKSKAVGGEAAAYAEALSPRPLYLAQFADWMRVQDELAGERPLSARHLEVLGSAVSRFLPSYKSLRPDFSEKPRLLIEKNGVTLDVRQLSDGERGVLALVLDLARRLSQANPTLDDPLHDGEAVVLLDEIDLHLHPEWQRQIVKNLTAAFPKCQFIATTHSPQVIGEVQPESLLLLRQEGDRIVPERCGQAYGLDANYVLEHIMGTAPRAVPATEAIHAVEHALEYGDLVAARERLAKLRTLLHGDDAVVIGLEATINNLEALGDAAYSEEE